jgi:anti-anti-sigma factor
LPRAGTDRGRGALDLAGATFIDSVGLGVVIGLAGELEERGVALRILPGPPKVGRVFATAGLVDALRLENCGRVGTEVRSGA